MVVSTAPTDLVEIRTQEVRQSLSCLTPIGSDIDIIRMSLIRNIRVIGDDVYVRLFHGSDQGNLLPLVRDQLAAIPWTNRVVVDPKTITGVKRTLAIGSGKGGVGKTSVTLALARTLRSCGYSVGILDADVYGPNISTLLGADDVSVEISDGTEGTLFIPLDIDQLKVMSVGMLASQGQSLAWRGPILTRLLKQFMYDVAWGELDFLLIDLPPGTGDAQITILQESPVASVLLVGVPGLSSDADLQRTVAMYKQFGLPILGFVENFSSMQCPNCGSQLSFLLDQNHQSSYNSEDSDLNLLTSLPIHPEVLSRHSNASVKTLAQIHQSQFMDLARHCIALI